MYRAAETVPPMPSEPSALATMAGMQAYQSRAKLSSLGIKIKGISDTMTPVTALSSFLVHQCDGDFRLFHRRIPPRIVPLESLYTYRCYAD